MPTYLKYKYIFFFISISGRIRNIFPAEPDPDPWKKMSDPRPYFFHSYLTKGNEKKKNIRYKQKLTFEQRCGSEYGLCIRDPIVT